MLEMKPIPCRLPQVRELLDPLPGQRAAAPLALPKPGVKTVSRGCAGPGGGAERVYGVSPQRLCRWGDFCGRREAGQGQAVLEQRCLGARRGSRAAGGEGLGSIRLLGQVVRA